MEGDSEQISLRGIVIPVAWDERGNAIKAAILTANEQEYAVEEDEKGNKLLALVQHVVEISGVVREEAGCKIITVEACQKAE